METADQLRVSFPAEHGFDRVGRVAVSGLALRLGFDVASVERLRLAVDRSVAQLAGRGRVELVASWSSQALVLEVSNPSIELDDERRRELCQELSQWVADVRVEPSHLRLVVPAGG